MENATIQMIELLSLKQLSARCQMEVAITYSDGYEYRDDVEIDDLMYNQIASFQRKDHRIRLSLYTKWDPYQRRRYSSVVRISGSFRETLYLTCSERYVQLLQELKQKPKPAEQCLEEASIASLAEASNASAASRTVLRRARRLRSLSWKVLATSGVLLLFFLFRMNDLLFIDQVGALGQRSEGSKSIRHADSSVVEAAGTGENGGIGDKQPKTVLLELADEKAGQQLADQAAAAVTTAEAQAVPKRAAAAAKPPKQPEKQSAGYKIVQASAESYTYKLPDGYVALTFDDGPSAYTKQIVDILTDHGVAGTFFFVGKNASSNSEEVAYAAKHQMSIGNHSWDHSMLTHLTDESSLSNLEKANDELTKDGAEEITLFRPPYGLIDDDLAEQAKSQNMKVLMWNRDPEDWNADTRDEIIEYFKKKSSSGGIYVLHEKKHTVEALPEIIQYLQEQNLKFVVFQ